MASVLKVIKSKAFKAQGQDHMHHTVAYKGRLFGVNSLRFEEGDFTLDDKEKTIILNVDCELKKDTRVDQVTGETTEWIGLVPKLDLALASI